MAAVFHKHLYADYQVDSLHTRPRFIIDDRIIRPNIQSLWGAERGGGSIKGFLFFLKLFHQGFHPAIMRAYTAGWRAWIYIKIHAFDIVYSLGRAVLQ